MAIWGSRVYENDTAIEVLDYAIDTCKSGFTPEEWTQRVTDRFGARMKDSEESGYVWVALADVQWNAGMPDPYTQSMALRAIQNYLCLGKVGVFSLTDETKEEWINLQTQLLSPPPAPVQFFKKKPYHCEWKFGDVYCYPLDSPYAIENGLEGKCFLLHKVRETIGAKGVVQPIVRVKIAEISALPSCTEEFDRLEYVSICKTNILDKFLPIDYRRPAEIRDAELIEFARENPPRWIPEYQIMLGTTSRRSIPKKVTYLGNFPNAEPPTEEFVPRTDHNIQLYVWKSFDKIMINTYLRHKKRELSN